MRQVSISYTSFSEPEGYRFPSGYSGSASWRITDDEIQEATRKNNPKKPNTKPKKRSPFRGVNQKKLAGKIRAFSALEKSQRFFAFFTITFPRGFPDENCYRVFNTVLTRIRKIHKDFDYIWVAERQGNGTLHYHMVTNSYINVRVFNGFAAKAIQNEIYKEKLYDLNYSRERYNGVDVRRVYNKRVLGKYITKYVTKNPTTARNAVWHCSRPVSALMITFRTEVNLQTALKYFARHLYTSEIIFWQDKPPVKIHTYGYTKDPPDSWFRPLNQLNEALYNLSKN